MWWFYLCYTGVSCVIAKSSARIFFRNAINVGLPIMECPEAVDAIAAGDIVRVDTEAGVITNERTGETFTAEPFPPFIAEIIEAGGLVARMSAKIAEGKKVLAAVGKRAGVTFAFEDHLIGGAAIDVCGDPLPAETLAAPETCDAVLLASVGGPKWDSTDPTAPRPEQGLLRIRKELGLYTNLRPVKIYDAPVGASTLRSEVIKGVDMVLVRELTGGIYFGKHERFYDEDGAGAAGAAGQRAVDVMEYRECEIERIARQAFEAALLTSRGSAWPIRWLGSYRGRCC